MQAADLPTYIKLHSMHTTMLINLAAKMMNLQQQSGIEIFICTLFADWTHKLGLLQYSPQPLSSGHVTVAHRVGGAAE